MIYHHWDIKSTRIEKHRLSMFLVPTMVHCVSKTHVRTVLFTKTNVPPDFSCHVTLIRLRTLQRSVFILSSRYLLGAIVTITVSSCAKNSHMQKSASHFHSISDAFSLYWSRNEKHQNNFYLYCKLIFIRISIFPTTCLCSNSNN